MFLFLGRTVVYSDIHTDNCNT